MLSLRFIKENTRSILFLLVIGILALAVSTAITVYSIRYEDLIRQFSRVEWLVFYVGTCFTMAFALTPTTFIALFSGYFLGWTSLPFMSVAYMIASWISYKAGSLVDRGKFMQTLQSYRDTGVLIHQLKKGQLGMIILCRLSPILPFAVMNILFSMLKVDMKKYIWGSFIGMLPRTIIAIAAGTQAQTIRLLWEKGEDNTLVQVGFTVLLIVSIAGIAFYIKKALQKTVSSES
jgi:uncharacterized membrane protein YdjX (TVP38/TMEM64 family)